MRASEYFQRILQNPPMYGKLNNKTNESAVEKEKNRKLIIKETKTFLARGGQITVLKPEVIPSTPSINIDAGWGWEELSGLGMYTGAADLNYEPVNCNIPNYTIIETFLDHQQDLDHNQR
jgi:hypothetical protein